MKRHRACAATLLGALALLLAPAPAPAQGPYSGGLSWPGAYSPTMRYAWYGYNFPYRGYYLHAYHALPYFPTDKAPSSSDNRSSYSYGAAADTTRDDTARVTVRLPHPDAEVWVEGRLTRQTGTRREFVSPPLSADTNYDYELRARWTENGRAVERTRTIHVRAGGSADVDFADRE
jgi:uncharacterized protein (TIGR03000 family)